MSKLITRGARLAAAAALAGAAAFGTAQATDWDKLGSWDAGDETGQATMGEVAATDANAAANWGAEIATAFQGLGMEPARAECYGNVLTEKLAPEDLEEAAQLVSSAATGEDVRLAVMDSGPTMVGGFSAADATCPEGMS